MTHANTVKSISDFNQVDRSTVKRWVLKARIERPDLGQLIDNTWYFTDDEAKFIASFAKPVATQAINKSAVTPPIIEIVDDEPEHQTVAIVPTSFDRSTMRGGLTAVATLDPNSIAQSLQVMRSYRQALEQDAAKQLQDLQDLQGVASEVAQEVKLLETAQATHKLRSEMLALIQLNAQNQVQTDLGKLQQLSVGGS
jgi:hypothetical protein